MKPYPNFAVIFTTIICLACGLQRAEYIDYDEISQKTTPGTKPACTNAEQIYVNQLASGVDGTCALSSCHGATSIGSNTLIPGSNKHNRQTLRSYDSSRDGSKLFGKLSGQQENHGGSDQSSVLPASSISTWAEAETDCESN